MFEDLNDIIRREMERGKLPGLAIALVQGEEIVWSRGYGYADLEKKASVRPSTVFSVQSVTKPVVTTALMQWHDQGRFQLDNAANDHLGPICLENEWEESSPVTIRQLLTHTSGLPVDMEALPSAPEEGEKSLQEYLAGVCKTVRRPGEEIVYANWGYDLAGYLIGRFAGGSYVSYLGERVLAPLGMKSSRIGPPESGDVATGYYLSALDGRHYTSPQPFTDTDPPRPCGALYSTVEDLGRFLIAHLNGGVYEGRRILSGEAVSDMHRLHARADGSRSGMGLAFRFESEGGRRLICHGGDGTAFTALIAAHPEESAGVALLINMGRAQTARSVIGMAALRALLGEPLEPEQAEPSGPTPAGGWEAAAGCYRSNYWGIGATLTVDDGAPVLNVEGGVVASEEGELSYLHTDADGVTRGRDGMFDGFELTFEFDSSGKATCFHGGLYPFRFDRVGDVRPVSETTIDEEADMTGRWSGTVDSPLGPVPVSLSIVDSMLATVTTLSAQDAILEEFRGERGRISGHVDVSLPGLGDFRVFLRLGVVEGKLVGKAYARGEFGEAPMKAELTRE